MPNRVRHGWTVHASPAQFRLHQVRLPKLAADAGAELTSLVLIWRGRRKLGLAVHVLLPVAASVALLLSDPEPLRSTRRGRYVLAHMPPAAQALRLAGDALMTIGAWRRDWRLVTAGALVVAAGWSHGVIRE